MGTSVRRLTALVLTVCLAEPPEAAVQGLRSNVQGQGSSSTFDFRPWTLDAPDFNDQALAPSPPFVGMLCPVTARVIRSMTGSQAWPQQAEEIPDGFIVQGKRLLLTPLTKEMILADAESYRHLLERIPYAGEFFQGERTIADFANDLELFDPEYSYAVVQKGTSQPIALAICTLKESLHLGGLVVAPGWTGTGVARWLFLRTLLEARERGQEKIAWFVAAEPSSHQPDAERAVPFYERIVGAQSMGRHIVFVEGTGRVPLIAFILFLNDSALRPLKQGFRNKIAAGKSDQLDSAAAPGSVQRKDILRRAA